MTIQKDSVRRSLIINALGLGVASLLGLTGIYFVVDGVLHGAPWGTFWYGGGNLALAVALDAWFLHRRSQIRRGPQIGSGATDAIRVSTRKVTGRR